MLKVVELKVDKKPTLPTNFTSSCTKENCLVNTWEIKKNLLVHHLWNGDPSSWFMLNLTSFWKRNFNIILPPPLLTLLITGPWVWLTSPLARLAFEPSWPCLWNGWLALGPEWLALSPRCFCQYRRDQIITIGVLGLPKLENKSI